MRYVTVNLTTFNQKIQVKTKVKRGGPGTGVEVSEQGKCTRTAPDEPAEGS